MLKALGNKLADSIRGEGNLRDGLLVFTGVPFSLIGGVLAPWLRNIRLSIFAGIKFYCLVENFYKLNIVALFKERGCIVCYCLYTINFVTTDSGMYLA